MELRQSTEFGMEMVGGTLAGLSGREAEQLRGAVDEGGLVTARGQFLTRESHVALALEFGPIDEYDTRVPNASTNPFVARAAGVPVVVEATDEALGALAPDAGAVPRWRLDGSFKDDPVCYSTEAAMDIVGGPWGTCFTNLQRAFERLSETDRTRAERTRVWHSAVYAKSRAGEIDVPVPDDPHELPGASHPLVRAHPATGRKGLYLGENAVAVEGESPESGRELLDHYLQLVSVEDNVTVHRWETGDVVIWDSRFVAHRRLPPVGTGRATIRHISVLSGEPS